MSGGGTFYISTSFPKKDSCVINFETTLTEPNADALSSIVIGQELDVTVMDGDIVVINDSDVIVGKIVHEMNERLKICIIKNLYIATVLENESNVCKVKVSWVSQF